MVLKCCNICDTNKCCFYSISEDISAFDIIRIRLALYSLFNTSIHIRIYIESIRIWIRIRGKMRKQIKYRWYPSIFDPFTFSPAPGRRRWPEAGDTKSAEDEASRGRWDVERAFCIIRIQNIHIAINSHDQTRGLFAKMSAPGACGKAFCRHRRYA